MLCVPHDSLCVREHASQMGRKGRRAVASAAGAPLAGARWGHHHHASPCLRHATRPLLPTRTTQHTHTSHQTYTHSFHIRSPPAPRTSVVWSCCVLCAVCACCFSAHATNQARDRDAWRPSRARRWSDTYPAAPPRALFALARHSSLVVVIDARPPAARPRRPPLSGQILDTVLPRRASTRVGGNKEKNPAARKQPRAWWFLVYCVAWVAPCCHMSWRSGQAHSI